MVNFARRYLATTGEHQQNQRHAMLSEQPEFFRSLRAIVRALREVYAQDLELFSTVDDLRSLADPWINALLLDWDAAFRL